MTRLGFAYVVLGFSLGACGGNSDAAKGSSAAGAAGSAGTTSGPVGGSGGSGSGAGGSSAGGSSAGTGGSAASPSAGTGGSAGSQATGGDAGAASGTPPYSGSVQFGWFGAATFQSIVSATFTNPSVTPEFTCTVQTFGSCTVSTCTEGVAPASRPQAGVITVKDDQAFNTSLSPSANGSYTADSPPGIAFPGDQIVMVTAAGGDVPAFSGMVKEPLVLLVTNAAAANGTFSATRSQDLTLTFDRGTTGVDLLLQGSSPATGTMPQKYLACTFPSAAGTATIPTAALAPLAAGTVVDVFTTASVTVSAGQYSVNLISFGPATNPPKTAGVHITLQ